jgi:hypothetical protein
MGSKITYGLLLTMSSLMCAAASVAQPLPLRVGTFQADATPPLGTPLIVRPVASVKDSLQVKGVVLLGDGLPVVLAAVDWIGIANSGHEAWRNALAEAAGTSPDRVAVHALHQHDAPENDFDAELLLLAHGRHGPTVTSADFARATIRRTADAVRRAIVEATPVTHVGLGRAKVEKVASNRRLHGPDGKVAYVRFSQTGGKPHLRDLPEDLIDPDVRMISFWNGSTPIAALTYYATHPQSYYGEGEVSYEFVGMAREQRQEDTGVFHVHFNGAAGNVAAGKYNDGSREMRPILAQRLAEGMENAWKATEKRPVTGADLGWEVEPVLLPVAPSLNRDSLMAKLRSGGGSAGRLAFVHRMEKGMPILISALRIGDARVLHMPGELFVEYQLAAQTMRPDLFVAMAAYGDYGTGYIGTRVAYPEGGYEVPGASNVAPDVEAVLTRAMREVLDAPEGAGTPPSEFTRRQPRYPVPL